MPKVNTKTIVYTVALTCCLCALAVACFWQAGRVLPAWTEWNERQSYCDLDGDGELEKVSLTGRQVYIEMPDGSQYIAPSDWKVSDLHIANIDHEGDPEIVMLAWRQGSFGDSHPFWMEGNDRDFCQHIYVFNFEEGKLVARWMSSDVRAQIKRMQIDGEGIIHLTTTTGNESTWEWLTFGIHQIKETNPTAHVSLIAVGDNLAHDSINIECQKQDGSFDYHPLYEHVSKRIASFDLTAVQQETIFVHDASEQSGYPRFGTPEAMGDALVDAGFDIVCSASNHSLDKGSKGVEETLQFWESAHPETTVLGLQTNKDAADAGAVIEKNDIRFALYDYAYGINEGVPEPDNAYMVDTLAHEEQLLSGITANDAAVDFTVCFLHIGEEYASSPSSEQQATVKRLIEAGADCVICTHSHVVQPAQILVTENGNQGVAFWGLGNFMSHQYETAAMLGGAAEIDFYLDAEGKPYIGQWGLTPLVCHRGADGTSVYFLEDYTEELALNHALNEVGETVSLEELWTRWNHIQLTQ